jgi:hypothetical protein
MDRLTKLITDLRSAEIKAGLAKQEIDDLRQLIMTEMQRDGLKQVKTDNETVSIAKRVSYDLNEFEWRKWAQQQPELEVDLFYDTILNSKKVTAHAENELKITGEIVPGITARETEYLSIRKAAK